MGALFTLAVVIRCSRILQPSARSSAHALHTARRVSRSRPYGAHFYTRRRPYPPRPLASYTGRATYTRSISLALLLFECQLFAMSITELSIPFGSPSGTAHPLMASVGPAHDSLTGVRCWWMPSISSVRYSVIDGIHCCASFGIHRHSSDAAPDVLGWILFSTIPDSSMVWSIRLTPSARSPRIRTAISQGRTHSG